MNEGMLGRAMEKTATLKNVSLTQGDVTKMPFSDNQFDAVCCNQVCFYPTNYIRVGVALILPPLLITKRENLYYLILRVDLPIKCTSWDSFQD